MGIVALLVACHCRNRSLCVVFCFCLYGEINILLIYYLLYFILSATSLPLAGTRVHVECGVDLAHPSAPPPDSYHSVRGAGAADDGCVMRCTGTLSGRL